jgi:LL-diaminopimelate aminotransferase
VVQINPHYQKLRSSYLFSEIANRLRAFTDANPSARVIRMGIGDVTRPLPPAAVAALHAAVDDMSRTETFKGYGPDFGYDFLIERIVEHDYGSRGVKVAPDEIIISDGGKQDSGNIQEIFSSDCVVAVTDPVYPVYVDTNVMAGRSGPADAEGRYEGIVYLPCTADNGFVPALPSRPVDLIYLCYPNNPTGAVMTRAQLRTWVDHARRTGAVIVYDAAYEAYIREPEIPHTIYEVEGAREVAIEIRSYSKTAGFTGTRLAFTVVPKECTGRAPDGSDVSLNALWRRRQSTKYNAAPYIIQKAGVALYTPEGQKQVREAVDFYMENARVIRDGVEAAGMQAYGGRNSPYVWLKTPPGLSSWDFFDKLLGEAHVVGTPGAGFGPCGEGYFRLTGFNSREATQEAVERIRTRLRL